MAEVSGAAGVGGAIETPRLTLTPATLADLEPMAWLAGATAPEWTSAELAEEVAAGRGMVLRGRPEGNPIGLIVWLADLPVAGAASVPFIAVAPERRFRGLGGEAALALERHLRRLGFARVYAPVPEGRGLAVYFWLRIGYRPLVSAEAPWPLAGLAGRSVPGIWLVRE